MFGCLYFARYWATCVLSLFADQVVTLWILKLPLSFNQAVFSVWPKNHVKNLNILRTERAFKMKQKAFFIIFQGLSVAKNCLRPDTAFLTILAIKRRLLWNFTKRAATLWDIVARVWNFQFLFICKSSISLYSLLEISKSDLGLRS